MFPRLHPLWHKSRLDFERPEAAPPCTAYGTSEALTVEVGPGDVLYVPPLWWHTVETLSPSASLSTLSRYHALYNRMQGLYRMTYHFDKLAHYEARPYPNPIPIPNPNPNPNPNQVIHEALTGNPVWPIPVPPQPVLEIVGDDVEKGPARVGAFVLASLGMAFAGIVAAIPELSNED